MQPIDRHLLETLYSDAVYYGMPMAKAIEVLSQGIFKKLNGQLHE